jgi:hypothetical protein
MKCPPSRGCAASPSRQIAGTRPASLGKESTPPAGSAESVTVSPDSTVSTGGSRASRMPRTIVSGVKGIS